MKVLASNNKEKQLRSPFSHYTGELSQDKEALTTRDVRKPRKKVVEVRRTVEEKSF